MTVKEIYEVYPEIAWITDEELRNKVADIWVEAINENGWTVELMAQCPINFDLQKECADTNLKHISDVANIAVRIYDYLLESHGPDAIRVDRNELIAAALLHDVGKMYEYRIDGDHAVYSEDGKHLRHPLIGAIVADRHGLSKEIVHAIATHSFEGAKSYVTQLSAIIKAADHISYQSLTFYY